VQFFKDLSACVSVADIGVFDNAGGGQIGQARGLAPKEGKGVGRDIPPLWGWVLGKKCFC